MISKDSQFGGILGGQSKFMDPFLLPSNEYIPRSREEAFDFCLFLFYMNPQYRRATQRVVSHFVTDIEFVGKSGDQTERDNLYSYLRHDLDIFGHSLAMGEEWGCFSGDTRAVTKNGSFPLKDLVGQRVEVLSKGGVYRPAEFKSFGVQELLEVEFSDGRVLRATPEHQWEIKNLAGKERRVTTTQLRPGYRIERTVAPRPERNEEYQEGVRHGFIFGDGSLSSKGKRSTALFCGHKDTALQPFFAGHGNPLHRREDHKDTWRKSGFPAAYKKLPEIDKSASYWYGFVSGFLAADGTADVYGCAVLTQVKRDTLEAIVAQLPRIGMTAGPVRPQTRTTNPGKSKGRDVEYVSTIHFVTLLKRFMLPEDFIIPAHRKNFEDNWDQDSNYGQFIQIADVRKTGVFEEVFCCVEMETHTFVVDNAVLTGNCYGNSFSRINFPFDRYLVDRRGGGYREYALSMFGDDPSLVKFNLSNMEYEVWDPQDNSQTNLHSKARVSFPFRDRRSMDWTRIELRKIDPRRVILQHSWISGRTRVIWRFEEELITQIKKGDLYQVNEMPIAMLHAIAADQDFAFNYGEVYHLKAPTISGISNHGWGLPETIANYRSLHQIQIYRRIDEAVGLDYMLPFRLFSPTPQTSTDPNGVHSQVSMGMFSAFMREMIERRRKDPHAIHSTPFPVTYQEMGATGKQLVPYENIEFHTNDMLDGMGYPAELFRGSLQVQQIPTAMRLFENTFYFLHRHLDGHLKWAVRRILDYLNKEQMEVTMQLPTMADDLEERHIYLQLAASGEISRAKAYRPFGVDDPVQEAKNRMQEDIEIQKEQAKLQGDFEREQTMGSMDAMAQGGGAGGGAGAAPGGAAMTPLDIMQQAEQKAVEILQVQQQGGPGESAKLLRQLAATNPTLHAATKQKMEEMRSQGGNEGRKAVGQ